ncbi:hypothetical protein KIPB_005346 [Kipferlia bialata]|uniref:Uncharacterized protein n=1 Tax=Kipferlia bialata TaxID=797122 RepID=A0A9K3GH91_9EUKA|nr:hypothetical protein KIPB_005346 [Kipferlia bialata]|eukprot:g5346.t1
MQEALSGAASLLGVHVESLSVEADDTTVQLLQACVTRADGILSVEGEAFEARAAETLSLESESAMLMEEIQALSLSLSHGAVSVPDMSESGEGEGETDADVISAEATKQALVLSASAVSVGLSTSTDSAVQAVLAQCESSMIGLERERLTLEAEKDRQHQENQALSDLASALSVVTEGERDMGRECEDRKEKHAARERRNTARARRSAQEYRSLLHTLRERGLVQAEGDRESGHADMYTLALPEADRAAHSLSEAVDTLERLTAQMAQYEGVGADIKTARRVLETETQRALDVQAEFDRQITGYID